MTGTDSAVRTIATVVAVLLAIPLVMMGIVMPIAMLTGVGHVSFSHLGWRILMPIVPLSLFGGLLYVLYTGIGGDDDESDAAFEELRSAYARGELSESEFEARRERLRASADADRGGNLSTDE